MFQPRSFLFPHPLPASTLVLTILTAFLPPSAPAQTNEPAGPKVIHVEVSLDLSKTGQDRCVLDPEDLRIPAGASTVTWTMAVGNSAAAGNEEPELDHVGFSSSLPVTVSERLDAQRWRVTFDREEAFPETPYDVIIREANGTVTECYPHVAGSADQGGG